MTDEQQPIDLEKFLSKRRPGRPPQFTDMRRLAGCELPADLLARFQAVPGSSTRARLQALLDERDALRDECDALRERMADYEAMNERARAGFYAGYVETK